MIGAAGAPIVLLTDGPGTEPGRGNASGAHQLAGAGSCNVNLLASHTRRR